MYNYGGIRQAEPAAARVLCGKFSCAPFRDVPMHFLGVKWISRPHWRTCNQGRGRQLWHPAVSSRSLAESETEREDCLERPRRGLWLAVTPASGGYCGCRGGIWCSSVLSSFLLSVRAFPPATPIGKCFLFLYCPSRTLPEGKIWTLRSPACGILGGSDGGT